MVTEYLLLLMISTIILAGAFGLSTGPVGMFRESTPYLAKNVEEHIVTGDAFRPASYEDWEP